MVSVNWNFGDWSGQGIYIDLMSMSSSIVSLGRVVAVMGVAKGPLDFSLGMLDCPYNMEDDTV